MGTPRPAEQEALRRRIAEELLAKGKLDAEASEAIGILAVAAGVDAKQLKQLTADVERELGEELEGVRRFVAAADNALAQALDEQLLEALLGVAGAKSGLEESKVAALIQDYRSQWESHLGVLRHHFAIVEEDDGTYIGRDQVGSPAMVVVPAGSFEMGHAASVPRPRIYEVTFTSSFAIGAYPVTVGEFEQFVRETGYRAGKGWRYPGFRQADSHPVVCVSWVDAQAYADWLSLWTGRSYRLPSESEWEYAVYAGSTEERNLRSSRLHRNSPSNYWYPGGSLSWIFGSCRRGTVPVGWFPPNAWGVRGTSGKAEGKQISLYVDEWVQDLYDDGYLDDYDRAPTDGSPSESIPNYGGARVLRNINRNRTENPSSRINSAGFRVAKTLASSGADSPRATRVDMLRRHFAIVEWSGVAVGRDDDGGPAMVVIPIPAESWNSDYGYTVSGRKVAPLAPFAMGAYPVTVGEFMKFARDTGRHVGRRCRMPGFRQASTHPVVGVDWDDAWAYAEWMSQRTGKRYRLPSVAEWKYATLRDLHWQTMTTKQANYNANDYVADSVWRSIWRWMRLHQGTTPVGSFPPNAWGLHDMYGNVWEWVQKGKGEGAPTQAETDYEVAEVDESTEVCSVLGGSWKTPGYRLDSEYKLVTHRRDNDLGFRVVRSLKQ